MTQGIPIGYTSMSIKFLMITAFLFFLSWKKVADDFLLFCALFAVGLCVCVFIYQMENPHQVVDEETE